MKNVRIARVLGIGVVSGLVSIGGNAAQAADVTITGAEIAGGKLVVSGTTGAASTRVRLDGRNGAAFNAISDARKAFKFSVAYVPSDCVVSVQRLSARAAVASATEAAVANCALGLSPRGDWSAAADYAANDVVTHGGSSWLARRDSTGARPGEGGDWQLFAARGAAGDAGDAGAGGAGDEGAGDAAARRAPPTGPAGGDLDGNYPNPTIDVGAVVTNRIANNAVTTGKIGPGAVTTADIASGAVSGGKIADGTIGSVDIADGAVTSAKVLDDTIAGGGLAAADLQSNSVGEPEIGIDAVQATEIADNSIDAGEIVDNSLFSADLGASSVRGSELGSITRRSVVSAAIAPGATGSALSTCLAGERVITGGNDGSLSSVVVASRDESNGWRVFIRNNGGANTTVTTHAYCLQAS